MGSYDAEELESIAGRASEPLASYLWGYTEMQRDYVDVAYGDLDEMRTDRSDLRAITLAITQTCESLL